MPERVNEDNLTSKALREISTGMYVVTGRKPAQTAPASERDYLAAGLVCWLVQVSFEPPMVMVALKKDTDLQKTVESGQSFAVNVLAKGQHHYLPDFVRDSEFTHDHINGHPFRNGEKTECPILENALAFVECEVEGSYTPGDHVVYFGKVVSGEARREEPPLMEWETEYRYGG